jgi:hypothetical protein
MPIKCGLRADEVGRHQQPADHIGTSPAFRPTLKIKTSPTATGPLNALM